MDQIPQVRISAAVFSFWKPTLLFLRFFGTLPITFRFEENYFVVKRSLIWTIYGYTIGSAAACGIIWGTWMESLSQDRLFIENFDYDTYIQMINLGTIALGGLSVILSIPSKLKGFFEIISTIDKMQNDLYQSKKELRKMRNRSLFNIISTFIIIISVMIFDFYICTLVAPSFKRGSRYIIHSFSFFVHFLAVNIQQVANLNILSFTKKYLTQLNKGMDKQTQSMDSPNVDIIDFSEKYQEQTKFKNSNVNTDNCKSILGITQDRISLFVKIHQRVFFISRLINAHFGYNTLINLTHTTLDFIAFSWIYLTNIIEGEKVWHFWAMQGLWTFLIIFRLILIFQPPHKFLTEFVKSKQFIVKLLMYTKDRRIRGEVEAFAVQGKFYNVNFSALGIVDLKRALLTSILGTVTFCMVILVQFSPSRFF